jgi:hypothetical protein
VSGRRIEPGVHVVLKDGDTVVIGGSTRVYELHWVPPSQVVDEHTVCAIKERKEEEDAHQVAMMLRLLCLPPLYTIKEEEEVA